MISRIVAGPLAAVVSVTALVGPAAASPGDGGGGAADIPVCGYRNCLSDGEVVKVMTRNIFLGADLGPAFKATDARSFIEANGEILRQVAATNMPVRSKGLAHEIKKAKPDIVGLQEAALWRTGKVDLNAALKQKPIATHVYQDFIDLLLKQLNHGRKRYRLGYVTHRFLTSRARPTSMGIPTPDDGRGQGRAPHDAATRSWYVATRESGSAARRQPRSPTPTCSRSRSRGSWT
ncbi:MAG: hypothetical protein U0R64_07115 [Candidatus Nanopelagicales bacterium]